MATRFQIKGEIYKAEELDSISLADVFMFDEEVFQFRQKMPTFPAICWADVEEAMGDLQGKSEVEAARHPRAKLVLAATLWLTMRNAGKPMTFGDVLELNLAKEMTWLPDTEDKAAGANPTKRKSRASAADANAPAPSE